ncbi:MAG: hypothetical protein ACM34K_09960 [Bacillota bacterium]
MTKELLEKIDAIERSIDSGIYVHEAVKVSEFGGADVIITQKITEEEKSWLGESNIILSLQADAPGRRVVETIYSKELSWLFYELRDAFNGVIDFASKYEFYGGLAQSASDHLKQNGDDSKCQDLLKAVINGVRNKIGTVQ